MRQVIASAVVSLFLFPVLSSAATMTPSAMVPARRGAAPGKAGKITKMAAYIGIVEGGAQVLLDGVAPWTKAKIGRRLTPGTQIKTSGNGRVTIAFTDGSKVRLGNNAQFKLEKVKRSKIAVYIGLGRLEVWVKKLTGRTFTARNPVSVASVRGTVFVTNVESPTSATTDLFSGSLAVTDNFGRTRSLAAGQRIAANSQTGSTPPTPLPPNVTAPAEPPVSIPQLASSDSETTPLEGETTEEATDETADEETTEETAEEAPISEPNPVQDTATVSGSTP